MIMTILRMIPIIQTQVQILPIQLLPIQLLPTRTIPLSIHPLTTIMMTVPVIMQLMRVFPSRVITIILTAPTIAVTDSPITNRITPAQMTPHPPITATMQKNNYFLLIQRSMKGKGHFNVFPFLFFYCSAVILNGQFANNSFTAHSYTAHFSLFLIFLIYFLLSVNIGAR